MIRITFLDATTLKQVGRRIQPGEFADEFVHGLRRTLYALTPDGGSVVTASSDGELAWWDLETHEKTRALRSQTATTPSPSARTVSPRQSASTAVSSGSMCVAGSVRTNIGVLTGAPHWLLFSPDGNTVVSTSLDGDVTLWDAESAAPSATLRGHSASVEQPVFSPDGETLYTASGDGTVIAWDLTGNRRLGRPFTFTHDRAYDPAFDRHPGRFSADGRLIAVGLKERGIPLWDARSWPRRAAPLQYRRRGQVACLQTGRTNACSRHLEWHGDALGRGLAIAPARAVRTRLVWVLAVSFSADGTTLATASSSRREVLERRNRRRARPSSVGPCRRCCLQPDGASRRDLRNE